MKIIPKKLDKDKVKESASRVKSTTKRSVSKVTDITKTSSKRIQSFVIDAMPGSFAFFSLPEILKWSESLTKSAATIYDKALDAGYLASHIGGGSHRLFDGGHDLVSAWHAARDMSSDDTFQQEVIGYTSALWKDVTTVKGLPFVTLSKDAYDASAEWVSNTIPFATKNWFYDMMSFDVFEILSTGLGAASMIYFLSQDDMKRLSEMLGAMGIISIISANPLMGIAVIICTAYSYFIKKNKLDKKKVFVGASMAGISAAIFSVLGLPVLIEFAIVIVATKLIREKVLENEDILEFIKLKSQNLPKPHHVKDSIGKNYAKVYNTLTQISFRDKTALGAEEASS